MPGTPAHAELLACYANTIDAPDRLADTDGLASWLAEHELAPPSSRANERDLALARRLRDLLRDAMVRHLEAGPAPQPDLDDLSRDLPLRVSFAGPLPTLVPATTGVPAGLAALLVAITEAAHDGSWERLKLCRAEDCRYAYHDESKNHSRAWCAMGDCGNRAKTRAYRRRRRARTS